MLSSNAKIETYCFFIILVFFSCAFLGIMLPFFGAIFWAIVLAILFMPMQCYLECKLKGRKNIATIITICFCILIVVVPVMFVINSLFEEASTLLIRLKEGKLDFGEYLKHITDSLPVWLQNLLDKAGWTGDLADIRGKLSELAMTASQFAANQAYGLGQVTLKFAVTLCVMMYLLFFLLRDGLWMERKIYEAIPLGGQRKTDLFGKFSTVVKATVKGNIIVACIQGALGGVAFWFYGIQGAVLWGSIMAVLSLLPAVGASLVWGPVAIYFLVTGMIWQGVSLIIYGALVIGMIDNFLRPVLVGKDTKLPDWLVMLSTLGGISVFGINGFVLGPLVAAMFIAVWAVLTERRAVLEHNNIPQQQNRSQNRRRYYHKKKSHYKEETEE